MINSSDTDPDGWKRGVVQAVELLAAAPGIQLSWVRENNVGPDELALQFDDYYVSAAGRFSDSSAVALVELANKLATLDSEYGVHNLWTEGALLRATQWCDVRTAADEFLRTVSRP